MGPHFQRCAPAAAWYRVATLDHPGASEADDPGVYTIAAQAYGGCAHATVADTGRLEIRNLSPFPGHVTVLLSEAWTVISMPRWAHGGGGHAGSLVEGLTACEHLRDLVGDEAAGCSEAGAALARVMERAAPRGWLAPPPLNPHALTSSPRGVWLQWRSHTSPATVQAWNTDVGARRDNVHHMVLHRQVRAILGPHLSIGAVKPGRHDLIRVCKKGKPRGSGKK